MALTLSGTLSETPMTDVLSILRLQKATGTLTVKAGGVQKALCVENGQVIFASSQDERDRLGEIMIKTGKMNRQQLDKALLVHRANAGVKKIGAIFVESGYVTPKELFNGLKVQVRTIIQSLFLCADGEYRFDEKLPPDVIPLQINMEEVLREVVQQMKKSR